MTAADNIQAARALIEPLTGHTPGPWMQDGIAIAHPSEPNGYPLDICLMGEPLHFAGDVRPMLQNHEANALILAAAPALRDTVAALADLADAQAQEIERLRKVLGFYANPENWKGDEEAWERAENGDDDPETLEALLSTVELDGGKIARAALGETP